MPAANIRSRARYTLGIMQEFGQPFAEGSARDIRAEIPSSNNAFVNPNIPGARLPGTPAPAQPRAPGCCWKKVLGLGLVAWLVANA